MAKLSAFWLKEINVNNKSQTYAYLMLHTTVCLLTLKCFHSFGRHFKECWKAMTINIHGSKRNIQNAEVNGFQNALNCLMCSTEAALTISFFIIFFKSHRKKSAIPRLLY